MRCEVLVADPPWQFNQGTSANAAKFRGTVDQHYAALDLAGICAFPMPSFADDVTLFLWRVAAMQREALDVLRAWGFSDPKGEIVWRKVTKNGKRHIGMGRRVRAEHEICLIATRGSPGVLDKGVRSCFDAPCPACATLAGDLICEACAAADEPPVSSIFEARVGPHSAKPPEFFELVERLLGWPAPSTHVELFARDQRPGWTCYGNEIAIAHPPINPQPVENL